MPERICDPRPGDRFFSPLDVFFLHVIFVVPGGSIVVEIYRDAIYRVPVDRVLEVHDDVESFISRYTDRATASYTLEYVDDSAPLQHVLGAICPSAAPPTPRESPHEEAVDFPPVHRAGSESL